MSSALFNTFWIPTFVEMTKKGHFSKVSSHIYDMGGDGMDLQNWAENLVEEVCEKWEHSESKYGFSEHGFRVFYSPVYPGPDLMVIGYNPGNDEKPFSKEDDCQVPAVHEYFCHDSRMAKRMKYLFEGIDRDEWLEASIKLNLIFFRSENEAQWESLDRDIRDELEMFCFNKVSDIIDTLKPRYIVTEGLKVFDRLIHSVLMGCDEPEVKIGIGGRKIYARSRCGHSHIIGLAHLTKDRISYPEWNAIKKYLKSDLKELEQMYLH
jgi:hypothetical protein